MKLIGILLKRQLILMGHLQTKYERIRSALRFFLAGVPGWQTVHCTAGLPILNFKGGRLILGKKVRMQNRQFRTEFTAKKDAVIQIGDGSFINQGANIVAAKRITIGPHCLIGDLAAIRDHNSHEIDQDSGDSPAEVTIGRNVWIGARAIILAGVSIGDHSVIAAGSIVTHDIPEKVVAAGIPAKVIRGIRCSDDYQRR